MTDPLNNIGEDIELLHSDGGLDIYLLKTQQYKTNIIKVYWMDRLSDKNASANALLNRVMQRGSSKYPAMLELEIALEELYGAFCDADVLKLGDCQAMYTHFSYPADKYAGDTVSEKIAELAANILFDPLMDESGFNKDYVEQEKVNLISRIESRKDEKMHYALERCEEEMCAGGNGAVCEYGDIDTIQKLSPLDLLNRYNELLKKSQMYILLAGNFNRDTVHAICDSFKTKWQNASGENEGYSQAALIGDTIGYQGQIRTVIENMDVTQGKLTYGLTTGIRPSSKDYIPLMVANNILGGGMHSKLFNVVREQESLAYYISSQLDRYRGSILVACGIEFENKERVEELIIEQLEQVKKGEISDFEIDSAKKSLINTLKMIRDSQSSLLSFELGQILTSCAMKIDETIEVIESVTIDDVAGISRKIQPHTVYFLRS